MPKFRRKPVVIEAERFDPENGQWPAPVIEKHGLTVYRYSVYNALHNNYIPVKPGDYIRVDKPNDVYPIAESVLEKEYEEVNNE